MEDSGIDSGDPKPSNSKDDIEFFNTGGGSDSSCESNSSPRISAAARVEDEPTVVIAPSGVPGNSSTKQIQRKLEARIEQAKRKHRLQEYNKKSPVQGLIPIQRLPIPGVKEQQQPLVDYETDNSEEDIANFFPIVRAKEAHKHQDLTDTFSIEELSISGDDDEDDLHLVPPAPLRRSYECCKLPSGTEKCSIM